MAKEGLKYNSAFEWHESKWNWRTIFIRIGALQNKVICIENNDWYYIKGRELG